MLPERSVLIGQKLVENAKLQKFKCDILSNFQTMWTLWSTAASTFLRRKVYSHLRRFLWWWHGNHRDFVTFCRHCEPLLCSQVAFQAYEDVPNPTKKKMGQKWRRTKSHARKWYHHVFTAFFQCYCMQSGTQMALFGKIRGFLLLGKKYQIQMAFKRK